MEMPTAAYLFMALEAARQLRILHGFKSSVLGLTDVVFGESLSLARFQKNDTKIELQLIAKEIEKNSSFEFDIFSADADSQVDWIQHCSGKLHLNCTSTSKPQFSAHTTNYDPILLDQPQKFGINPSHRLKELQINSRGSSGSFDEHSSPHDNYPVVPMVLDSILCLSPISIVARNLPAIYKLQYIRSIVSEENTGDIDSGRFAISINSTHSFGCQSNIEILQGGVSISLEKLCYEVDKLIEPAPSPKSLFFKPISLPDVTKLSESRSMSILDCLRLVTHKWPMANVKVVGLEDQELDSLLEILENLGANGRKHYQSVQILGVQRKTSSDRIQYVDNFDADLKAHIIVSSNSLDEAEICKQLDSNGLICMREINLNEGMDNSDFLEMVCKVTGLNHDDWILWRKSKGKATDFSARRKVVFGGSSLDLSLMATLKATEYITLQEVSVREFCERDKGARFDAIVIDDLEKPVITLWAGNILLPWLQFLLKSAEGILWVTQRSSDNPFTNVAGTLLRTLQSEQPSLKVAWLVLRDADPAHVLHRHILSAYKDLLKGDNEVRLEVKDSKTSILRYIPDDDLSARTGLLLPSLIHTQIGDAHYQMSLAAPLEPVMLVSNPNVVDSLESGKLEVMVDASVVSFDPVSPFDGFDTTQSTPSSLGHFFAGRIVHGEDSVFPNGSQVVGWHNHPHQKSVNVTARQLHLSHPKSSASMTASAFAAIATASCIIDGVARAREGDTFVIRVSDILEEALRYLCIQSKAIILQPGKHKSADFVVAYDSNGKVLVNGSPLSIEKYLESSHGSAAVAQAWDSRPEFTSASQVFQLSEYREAFRAAQLKPACTILLHQNADKIDGHMVRYQSSTKLLAEDGIYIVIGGLGGLGRYVCSWMVAHGAKRLVVISRSGISSKEGQESYQAINDNKNSMQVIKADACDRTTIKDILKQIRQAGSIKGVINLAMLLGDAPMADMKGHEWDRALRVKIDSSWILHEETLQDPLDIFIMFSSIASVLGNRNQGNYNVGNTFLNALAEYRQSLGLPAISIALGAMGEFILIRSPISHCYEPG